jgi:hypothetical protein
MNPLVIHHDVANRQIGFAVQCGCSPKMDTTRTDSGAVITGTTASGPTGTCGGASGGGGVLPPPTAAWYFAMEFSAPFYPSGNSDNYWIAEWVNELYTGLRISPSQVSATRFNHATNKWFLSVQFVLLASTNATTGAVTESAASIAARLLTMVQDPNSSFHTSQIGGSVSASAVQSQSCVTTSTCLTLNVNRDEGVASSTGGTGGGGSSGTGTTYDALIVSFTFTTPIVESDAAQEVLDLEEYTSDIADALDIPVSQLAGMRFIRDISTGQITSAQVILKPTRATNGTITETATSLWYRLQDQDSKPGSAFKKSNFGSQVTVDSAARGCTSTTSDCTDKNNDTGYISINGGALFGLALFIILIIFIGGGCCLICTCCILWYCCCRAGAKAAKATGGRKLARGPASGGKFSPSPVAAAPYMLQSSPTSYSGPVSPSFSKHGSQAVSPAAAGSGDVAADAARFAAIMSQVPRPQQKRAGGGMSPPAPMQGYNGMPQQTNNGYNAGAQSQPIQSTPSYYSQPSAPVVIHTVPSQASSPPAYPHPQTEMMPIAGQSRAFTPAVAVPLEEPGQVLSAPRQVAPSPTAAAGGPARRPFRLVMGAGARAPRAASRPLAGQASAEGAAAATEGQ